MSDDWKSKWKTAEGFKKVPDDEYVVTVQNLEYKLTRETQKPMFSWDLVLPNGQHYFHNRVINPEKEITMAFAREDFEALGMDASDFDALLENLQGLIGAKILVDIKTKNGFQNCKVLELISRFDNDGNEIPF